MCPSYCGLTYRSHSELPDSQYRARKPESDPDKVKGYECCLINEIQERNILYQFGFGLSNESEMVNITVKILSYKGV